MRFLTPILLIIMLTACKQGSGSMLFLETEDVRVFGGSIEVGAGTVTVGGEGIKATCKGEKRITHVSIEIYADKNGNEKPDLGEGKQSLDIDRPGGVTEITAGVGTINWTPSEGVLRWVISVAYDDGSKDVSKR